MDVKMATGKFPDVTFPISYNNTHTVSYIGIHTHKYIHIDTHTDMTHRQPVTIIHWFFFPANGWRIINFQALLSPYLTHSVSFSHPR